MVHAFVIGRIDYCNSLLFGLPSVHLLKLQRLQNAAARLISNVPRFSFKAIYGHAPGYLIDFIAIKEEPRYDICSASGVILKYPSLKLK